MEWSGELVMRHSTDSMNAHQAQAANERVVVFYGAGA